MKLKQEIAPLCMGEDQFRDLCLPLCLYGPSIDPLPAWWGTWIGGLYSERQTPLPPMVEAVIFHIYSYLMSWKWVLVDQVCRQRGRSDHPQDAVPSGTGRESLDAATHRRDCLMVAAWKSLLFCG